jgi:hypothetical protein
MHRFTRLTNGHRKKVANHAHMVALYTMFYNFMRTHSKLQMRICRGAATLWHADLFYWIAQCFAPGQNRPLMRTSTTIGNGGPTTEGAKPAPVLSPLPVASLPVALLTLRVIDGGHSG